MNNPVSTRIILYVGFPNADNDVVLIFVTHLFTAIWLILIMTDAPIANLTDNSKFNVFQEHLVKFKVLN